MESFCFPPPPLFFQSLHYFSAMFSQKAMVFMPLLLEFWSEGSFNFLSFFSSLEKIGRHSFRIQWKDKYLGLLAYRLLPMLVGIVARQVNTIVDQFLLLFWRSEGLRLWKMQAGCICCLSEFLEFLSPMWFFRLFPKLLLKGPYQNSKRIGKRF